VIRCNGGPAEGGGVNYSHKYVRSLVLPLGVQPVLRGAQSLGKGLPLLFGGHCVQGPPLLCQAPLEGDDVGLQLVFLLAGLLARPLVARQLLKLLLGYLTAST